MTASGSLNTFASRKTPCQETDDLDFAIAQRTGIRDPPGHVPGCLEDRVGRLSIEKSAPHHRSKFLRRYLLGQRFAVWSVPRHRFVGIRGREHPGGRRHPGTFESTVVAGTIGSFVMHARYLSQGC